MASKMLALQLKGQAGCLRYGQKGLVETIPKKIKKFFLKN